MKKYHIKIDSKALDDIRDIAFSDTSTIEVLAIIGTGRNPKVWKETTGRI